MKKIFTLLFFAILGLNNINAATFSSVSSGTWSAPATWTITLGTDSDGIPDSDDDLTINGGHNIALAVLVNSCRSVINNGTITGNLNRLYMFGNLTNNGTVVPGSVVLYIQTNCVLTSTGTFSGAYSLWVIGNLTINPGTIFTTTNTINLLTGSIVSNGGNVSLNSSAGINLSGTSNWINGVNSNLSTNANIAGTGSLTASSAGNTVQYRNISTQIKSATYYNLTIVSATSNTRTAAGNITILNNFTITGGGTSNTFNLASFNLIVGGNWFNLANKTILNQGTITFNTAGTQTISRTTGNEVFDNMIIGGSGTTTLGKAIIINQSLTINSGIFDVSASLFSVNVLGNLIFNGGSIAQRGAITFNGTSAQTISGSATANFFNLISANVAGVSVTSSSKISNLLQVNSGSFGTSGSGEIIIPATGATVYGRIASVGGSLTGTGWKIESYINGPAPKNWQWLSSPINGNTLADWDNDPRFYMSGVGGNDGMAGSFKSVQTYSEITDAYVDVTTVSTPLTPGKGFQLWMSDNTTGLTAPLVYNSIGTPNFGNVSFPVTAGGVGAGYNLVGNPYACPITYSTVVASSGNLFSSFIVFLENGSYATDPNGGIIAPNQGFMCCASSSGNITFTEASKNTVTSPNILRTTVKNNAITLNVYNNINGLGGQTNIEFSENANDNFDQSQDLRFLPSPYEEADNIWTNSVDNTSLLRNVLTNNENEKEVPLTVKSGVYGIHHISVKGLANLNLYNSVWLEDLASGKKTDLLKEQTYSFNADEIGKEYNFVLHFSKKEKSSGINEPLTINTLNENTSIYNTESNVIVKFDMNEMTSVKISVYSLSGQQVIEPMNLNVTNDRIALPLQKENSLYLLIIQSNDQQITRKIIY